MAKMPTHRRAPCHAAAPFLISMLWWYVGLAVATRCTSEYVHVPGSNTEPQSPSMPKVNGVEIGCPGTKYYIVPPLRTCSERCRHRNFLSTLLLSHVACDRDRRRRQLHARLAERRYIQYLIVHKIQHLILHRTVILHLYFPRFCQYYPSCNYEFSCLL